MATNAQLFNPRSIFVSSSNDEVYIADTGNHTVRKILENGNIVTIAGNGQQGYSGDNGLAVNAQLVSPSYVFVSSKNEVYIADYQNNRIRKILENGNIITIAGNGQQGYNGDNGLAVNAQLASPSSVCVSLKNEVYIADSGNHSIRKILENGNIVTIAGNGQQGYNGDNGPAVNAPLFDPSSVFVTPNDEVYIADTGNHRIRKILRNGNIITIAGNGQQGYSGDNGPAVNAKLSSPVDVFVSSKNEVYIADYQNTRIRKILENGNIITIAGNGKLGYGGDNGLAVNAKLYSPVGVFVSQDNEVYIADYQNNRIRKILENGNIITIAGNGELGYDGDSVFDFSKYPHIGPIYSSTYGKAKLKKHSRDLLFNSSIYAFIPLVEMVSPLFCKYILKNESLISSMNSIQQEIIQKLIDSLIYNNEIQLKFNNDEILDVLFILGFFKNNEFIQLKKLCTTQFIQSLTIQNLSFKWEQIEIYLSQCSDFHLENYILEYLNNYCVEFAAIQMKTPGGVNSLPNLPIIVKNAANILSKHSLSQPNYIIIDEAVEIELMDIGKLYNDKKTSDLKIQIDEDNYLYCHKTILSSSSTLFNAMFDSGSTFTDLSNDIFIPDSSDDFEFLEIIIKTCYETPVQDVKYEKLLRLLDMAMKHEMEYLVKYCKNELSISIDNYIDIVSACENYIGLQCFEGFYNELITFGIKHRRQLFPDCETILKLPPKLLPLFFLKFAQEFL
ncbi:predicted protein [Naegleria gruberi]|uniref:Predicted protein n=1 Tax=Naegleria gruberi TaxID=5762 RepID=D2W434_NAEGR|nr:uncharacterized protein NAEGRDRAFT_76164 [Naegleria gruberi]EFC36192.1 predicted protein [Naegleria gruberi]|eukprot:XP_002668936.1 predicted protein [Naegleria gruberi strain NEG-M]